MDIYIYVYIYVSALATLPSFLPSTLTMNELYIAYHFPTQQYICLQECKDCFVIILRGGCPHNCTVLGPVNEDVSFLRYILSTIGEIFIDQESSNPILRGG